MTRNILPAPDTGRLAAELQARGYEPIWLQSDMFVTDIDGNRVGFKGSDAPITSLLARNAAKQKHIARTLLQNAGLAVAEGEVFDSDQLLQAVDYAQALGVPVVIKPTAGRKGRQVAVGITPGPAFEQAFRQAAGSGQQVLVERQFTDAAEARFLVVRDECVAVYGKKPPSVVGDGERSVQELIATKNDERRKNPHLRSRLIKLTEHRINWLATQGYTPDDVPPSGTTIVLDLNANVSAGGDSFDCTDDVHDSYKRIAITAAASVGGLAPAGVDIIARDFTAAATSHNYIVCEVNSRPALGAHHHPAQGVSRDAAGAIVEHTLREVGGKVTDDLTTQIPMPVQSSDLPKADEVAMGELYDRDAQLIALELMRRNIDVCWLSPEFFVAKVDSAWLGYWRTSSHVTRMPGVVAAARKDSVRQLMAHAGLEIPRGRFFKKRRDMEPSYERAASFATSRDTVVVKPVERRGGRGLTVGVSSHDQFERAWRHAVGATNAGVLVEEFAAGSVARFVVVGDHCAAVSRRSDPVGEEITDSVHGSFKAVAIRAAHAFPGLDVASVDIIAPDFAGKARPGAYAIVDVDSTPTIWPCHFPTSGKPRDVARAIVDYHLAQGVARRTSERSVGRLYATLRSKVRADHSRTS